MKYAYLPLLVAAITATSAIGAQDPQTTEGKLPSVEESYAADNGVSIEEAGRRLDQMREAGRLAAELRASEAETFGGMYVDHQPQFRIVALFTTNPAAALRRHNAPSFVAGAVSQRSERSLREEQEELLRTLRENGATVAAQTRVRAGEIDLYVEEESALEAALARAGITLNPRVRVRRVGPMTRRGEAAIYAGYGLREGSIEKCTAGFALTNGTTRYLSTAGHCANTLNYNGSNLPFWFEWYEAYNVYDFQVHTIGSNTVTNNIYVGSAYFQEIFYVYPYASMYEGEYICKYGRATGYTCGYVTSLTYSALGGGGFVRVEKDGANLSEGGDSGAPWYLSRFEEAWGIHSDAPFDDANDAFFMPASRFEDAGLRVLTSP